MAGLKTGTFFFSCTETTENDIFQLMAALDKRLMAGLTYFQDLRKPGVGSK